MSSEYRYSSDNVTGLVLLMLIGQASQSLCKEILLILPWYLLGSPLPRVDGLAGFSSDRKCSILVFLRITHCQPVVKVDISLCMILSLGGCELRCMYLLCNRIKVFVAFWNRYQLLCHQMMFKQEESSISLYCEGQPGKVVVRWTVGQQDERPIDPESGACLILKYISLAQVNNHHRQYCLPVHRLPCVPSMNLLVSGILKQSLNNLHVVTDIIIMTNQHTCIIWMTWLHIWEMSMW